MRIVGLTAKVEVTDPKSGLVATLDMFDVELEDIGFGCQGSLQHSIFQVQGSVRKNADGTVQFKKKTLKLPKGKS